MPKQGEYVVKLLATWDDNKGKYFRASDHAWVQINKTESYTMSCIEARFSLNSSHELLKVEQDGRLTHIR